MEGRRSSLRDARQDAGPRIRDPDPGRDRTVMLVMFIVHVVCKMYFHIVNKLPRGFAKCRISGECRSAITSVAKTVTWRRHGLPMRGHRDDGRVVDPDDAIGDGVFRGLIRFRPDDGEPSINFPNAIAQ